jgi:hypothetical protein
MTASETSQSETSAVPPPKIRGYTDRQSVAQGESIRFFISDLHGSGSKHLPISIIRLGQRQFEVASGVAAVHASPIPAARAWENNCWPVSYMVNVPLGWRSGIYVARVADETGDSKDIYFVVRRSLREPILPIVIQLPTTTINAYNNWGGVSLYEYNSRPSPATAVSFNRPQQSDALWPRGYGFAEEWNLRIRAFVEWMEAVGYEANFVTNNDLHENSGLLESCRLFISIGHDEYWSREMRRHLDLFIESGGNAAIFGGNTCYWQIRLDPDERTGAAHRLQVCCRGIHEKPNTSVPNPELGATDSQGSLSHRSGCALCGTGPATVTWRAAGLPENTSLGAGFALGAWRGVDRDPGAFTVFKPDHWVFSGTGLRRGDRFGDAADEKLLFYETSGVAYTLDNCGNPVPTGSDGTPSTYDILALADLPFWATPGNAALGILRHPRSGGTVFNAATTDWARGLETCVSSGDLFRTVTAKITRNVIDHLSR